MPVDFSKLVLSPPIQQNIIDPTTREPAIGEVYFYETGTTCLKPVYQRTNNPLNPYIAAENPLPLDSSGSLPFDIFFYPYDEDDSSVVQLYDLIVKRDDGTTILSRFQWPPAQSSGPAPSISSNTTNLCPNYEFHSAVNSDLYGTLGYPISASSNSVAWGWTLEIEKPDQSNVTYSFNNLNELSPIDIEGTPLRSLVVRATNSTTATGYRRLQFLLGMYSSFQNEYVYVFHYAANLSNINNIPIKLVRTKEGVLQSPITLGTLNVTSSALQKYSFTAQIPPITESGYSEDDESYIFLDLPQNQDFTLEVTANWYQVVQTAAAVGAFSQMSLGLARAAAYFKEGNLNVTDNDFEDFANEQDNDGEALTITNGSRDSIDNTGAIIQVINSAVARINNAIPITDSHDNLLLYNQTPSNSGYFYPKLSRANRLIRELSQSSFNVFHRFLSNVTAADTIEVSLQSGSFFSTWSTNNATAIVLTSKTAAYPYGVIATISGASSLTLQYQTNWSVQSNYSNDFTFRVVLPTNPPILRNDYPIPTVPNIRNWFGSQDISGDTFTYGNKLISQTVVPASGSLGVGLDLSFNSSNLNDYLPTFSKYYLFHETISGEPPFDVYQQKYNNFIEIPSMTNTIYGHPYNQIRSTGAGWIGEITRGNIHLIFSKKTPSTAYLTGRDKTVIIEMDSTITTVTDLLNKIVATFNVNAAYDIKFATLPSNGDWIKFSNDTQDFYLQFLVEGAGIPNAPSGSTTTNLFKIKFDPSLGVSNLLTILNRYFPLFVQGIPSNAQLGLTTTEGTSYMITL